MKKRFIARNGTLTTSNFDISEKKTAPFYDAWSCDRAVKVSFS